MCPLALLLVVLRFAGHHLFWQVHGIHADCPFLKMILWWCPLYWLNERLVPSKHWNWCPSVKISCLRDFWCHLLLFRLLLLLLFVTEKRTHSQQIKKSNFRILNCTFTPLSWLWMFYWTRQQKIQKPLFVSFSTADFFGRYGSCIRQCIFWQVHDGRK